MRLTVAAAAALISLAPAAASAQDAASAEGFLQGLYARYEDGRRAPGTLDRRAGLVFDAPLLALIRRDAELATGDGGYLNHDPICDCQDNEITDTRIRVRLAGQGAAAAEVQFVNLGHEQGVSLDLAWTAAGWRVHDVRGKLPGSLAEYLAKSLPPLPAQAAPSRRPQRR